MSRTFAWLVLGLLMLSAVPRVSVALPKSRESSRDAGTEERIPIIATGEQKKAIKSTDILDRPDRPFHFYGNTVRRRAAR